MLKRKKRAQDIKSKS